MIKLDLIVPGLLGPELNNIPPIVAQQLAQSLNQPEFKGIRKHLSRAHRSKVSFNTYFDTLVSVINPECTLSVCQIMGKADGIDMSQGYFYCADPVHFRAESDHAILLGTELLAPSKDEAEQLISAFNKHFQDDHIRLVSSSPYRWYLCCDKPLDIQSNALDYSMGRDIKHFLPTGEDALWWRKILNEAQMLFFQHEVAEKRESAGALAINGLWLWDVFPGDHVAPLNHADCLFSNDEQALALAKQAALKCADASNVDEITRSSVLVIEQLYEAVCYGDVDAWAKDLGVFCEGELQGVFDLLKSKKIDEINIYPCDGQVFKVNRMDLLKFWKPLKNIQQFAL